MIYRDIVLCADDFAQSESISLGILSLARQNRLNAVSCMVNMPSWPEYHVALLALMPSHLIGLHLNFTCGQALSGAWRRQYGPHFGSLSALMLRAYSHRLNKAVVAAEIAAQIASFTNDLQSYPDFIDGHQHIHQLPIMRDALLDVYQHELAHSVISPKTRPCYLRATTEPGWHDLLTLADFPKRQALAVLGGHTWRRMLMRSQVMSNSSFAGMYPFKKAKEYRHYFLRFLAKTTHHGLIMCHPGTLSTDDSDPLCGVRQHELAYFMSPVFLKDLSDNGVRLRKKQD